MNRRNLILAGALLLQAVVIAVVFWPRSASSAVGHSLFPDVKADEVVALTVSDAEGASVTLSKTDAAWVLPAADGYPAKEDAITAVITDVVGIKTDRLVAQTSSSHKRLKVADDDFERLIEFKLTDGTEHKLYVGSSPTYGVSHVRADNQDQVYLASLAIADLGTQARSWVDTSYVSIPQDDVTSLTIENASGKLQFERDDVESWTMVGLNSGETLDDSAVSLLVSRAANVTMIQPLGKEEQASYGMANPSAVVTLQTHNADTGDHTYTLTVGAQDPDDTSYVVISSESPYYVRVSGYSVQNMVENGRDDFLVQPTPTPTPEPESTPEG